MKSITITFHITLFLLLQQVVCYFKQLHYALPFHKSVHKSVSIFYQVVKYRPFPFNNLSLFFNYLVCNARHLYDGENREARQNLFITLLQ